MSATRLRVPRVYSAIHAIAAELADTGIARSRVNTEEGYRYRGIDDVLACLAPLLSKHRLCVLPRVLSRTWNERQGSDRALLAGVSVHVAYDLVSVRDGSVHTIEAMGEALDGGDKATAKAMSAAYKQAMLQAFCIPTGEEDADRTTHRLTGASIPSTSAAPDPVQGWDQWTEDIAGLMAGCTTGEALDRVQATYREQLRAISKRRPELYARIGRALTERRQALAPPPREPEAADGASSPVAAHG